MGREMKAIRYFYLIYVLMLGFYHMNIAFFYASCTLGIASESMILLIWLRILNKEAVKIISFNQY